jgi:hypothetical protein
MPEWRTRLTRTSIFNRRRLGSRSVWRSIQKGRKRKQSSKKRQRRSRCSLSSQVAVRRLQLSRFQP